MTGSTVEQLQALNAQADLKFHVGGILFGDESATCPDPDGLIAADGTLTVPAGYTSAGLITTDGITRSRSLSVDNEQAWQTLATVRSDVTDDQITLKVKFEEYNLVTFALREGLTLAAAASAFTSSGAASKRDAGGVQPSRRMIVIARDTNYGITLAQIVPNGILSAQGDETVARSTSLQLDATFNCNLDSAYGTDFASAINGPGMAKLLAGSVTATWQATHAYSLNDEVVGGGHIFKVTTAGTSGSTEPTWPASGTVTDGTVTWTFVS